MWKWKSQGLIVHVAITCSHMGMASTAHLKYCWSQTPMGNVLTILKQKISKNWGELTRIHASSTSPISTAHFDPRFVLRNDVPPPLTIELNMVHCPLHSGSLMPGFEYLGLLAFKMATFSQFRMVLRCILRRKRSVKLWKYCKKCVFAFSQINKFTGSIELLLYSTYTWRSMVRLTEIENDRKPSYR